jgi:hypothetical protein
LWLRRLRVRAPSVTLAFAGVQGDRRSCDAGWGRRRAAGASYCLAIIRIVISDKIFVHKLVLLSFFV